MQFPPTMLFGKLKRSGEASPCFILKLMTTIQDEELVKVIHFQKVYCASGESDTESIRDMESGSGEFRWHRRHPHWYRRDPCLDDSMSYRRRMKPNLQYENDVGEASLVWEPEHESDEDGFNKQPSFALTAQVATDQKGHQIGDQDLEI